MNSQNACNSVLVLDRPVAKKEISSRILELRKKIYDADYLENAVQRIAQVISKKMIEDEEFPF